MMNKKWYSLRIDEIEKALKTNAASGLSRKAARSRARKSGGNNFFYIEGRALKSCLRSIVSDPMLLLLIGVDIVAAIFGEPLTSISLGILIFLNIASSFFLYFRSQRIIELMSGYSQPKVRVIRNGELYIADSRCIVQGDIIIVGKGDILPCDARIISSNGLEASVFAGKNSNGDAIITAPDGNLIYPAESNLEFYEHKNMLFAGTEVLCGEARAVAVATGEDTYIGALDGGIALNDSAERPKILLDMKRFSRIYSFIVLLMILPLTLIGVFSYGADNILTTFMLTLSLAVSSLGELIYVIGNIIAATAIYDAASGYGKEDRSIIKSLTRCGALAQTDRLFLSGHAAFTDGKKRVVSIYANGSRAKGGDLLNKEHIPLAEAFYILLNASNSFPSLDGTENISLPKASFIEFSQKLGVDIERLRIAAIPMSFSSNDRLTANVNYAGKFLSVFASGRESDIDSCSLEDVRSENLVLSGERRSDIKKAFNKMRSEGCETYIITQAGATGEIFKGIIGFKEIVSDKVRETVASLRAAGVTAAAFFDEEKNEDIQIALDAGVISRRSEMAFSSDCKRNGIKIEDIAESVRSFHGFSSKEKCEIIEYLRKKGHTVSVFATSPEDKEIFASADVRATCDRASFDLLRDDFEQLHAAVAAGSWESPDGAQNLRLSADVLTRRASLHGGGTVGLYNAISTARRIQKNLVRAVTYLLCSQLVRFVFVIPAMIFGKILLTPFHLLFGGLIVDLGAVLVLSFDRHEKNSMRKQFTPIGLKNPIGLCRKMLFMTAMSAGSEVITALLTVMIGKDDVSGAVFLSVTLSQLILLFILRLADAPRFKDNIVLIAFSAFVIAAVAAFSLIPSLATLTGTLYSVDSIICISILPLRIISWFVYTRIKRWAAKKREKKSKKSY